MSYIKSAGISIPSQNPIKMSLTDIIFANNVPDQSRKGFSVSLKQLNRLSITVSVGKRNALIPTKTICAVLWMVSAEHMGKH